MEKKDYYQRARQLHGEAVLAIRELMEAHRVTEVDLLGSSADHAFLIGRPAAGEDVMEMEVSVVYLEDGAVTLDVILDIDTVELAEQNEDGDIGDAYQAWDACDFTHFIPCAGIASVYDSVFQVLEWGA